MGRLTIKNENVDFLTGVKFEYETDDLYAVDKLGKLEDIEEELGIDLLTLFKALKNGIYVKNKEFVPKVQFSYMELDNEYVFIYGYYFTRFKDYKKGWWLKEDLENE